MTRSHQGGSGIPSLIIAPPLSGCTTLAAIAHKAGVVIDCDLDERFTASGLSLLDRKQVFARALETAHDDVIVLPVLPDREFLHLVSAVVLIPAEVFVKRLLQSAQTSASKGRFVAALTWRDEALALSTQYDLPTHNRLTNVPELTGLATGADHEHTDRRRSTPPPPAASDRHGHWESPQRSGATGTRRVG